MSYLPKLVVIFFLVGVSFLLYNHEGLHRAFQKTEYKTRIIPMPKPTNQENHWTAERFRIRRQRVHEICERRMEEEIAEEENLGYILKQRVYIIWDYNVSICTMGKVGSGTWREHTRILNHLNYHPMDDTRRAQLFKQPSELVMNYSMSLSRWITVRHPLTRLVSCYQDKYKNGSKSNGNKVFHLPALRSNGLLPENMSKDTKIDRLYITFKEFIIHVIRSFEGGYVNYHWDTYIRQCSPCLFDFDYITKIETQAQDLEYLFEKFGIPQDPDLALKLKGDQYEKMKRDLRYYEDIPMDMRKKIIEIYKEDMEMFEYEIPDGFIY